MVQDVNITEKKAVRPSYEHQTGFKVERITRHSSGSYSF